MNALKNSQRSFLKSFDYISDQRNVKFQQLLREQVRSNYFEMWNVENFA